jgi:hypothetical protein
MLHHFRSWLTDPAIVAWMLLVASPLIYTVWNTMRANPKIRKYLPAFAHPAHEKV